MAGSSGREDRAEDEDQTQQAQRNDPSEGPGEPEEQQQERGSVDEQPSVQERSARVPAPRDDEQAAFVGVGEVVQERQPERDRERPGEEGGPHRAADRAGDPCQRHHVADARPAYLAAT
jgi:hypothetical protein